MTPSLKVEDTDFGLPCTLCDSPGSREDEQRCLVSQYGGRMSAKDVAVELGYSYIYFTKKIGNAKYCHLDWVQALLPARVKNGAAYVYKTSAVEGLMKVRGLL